MRSSPIRYWVAVVCGVRCVVVCLVVTRACTCMYVIHTHSTRTVARASFPRKNAERSKNCSHETESLSETVHGCRISPYLAYIRCASQERATQCRDFTRGAPGKTIFLHFCSARATLVGVKQITRTLQGLASSWDSILTPARDATQRRGTPSSRRANAGLDTNGVTKPCKGSNGGKVQDSEPQASRPPPRGRRCDRLASRGQRHSTDLHQG